MAKANGEGEGATRVPGGRAAEAGEEAAAAARVPSASGFARLLVLGHRGSPALAIENTLQSFAIARAAGADGVELDVRRSGDGVPVVIHDDTLDRTMHVAGRVSKLAWAAIQRLSGARVPSLEQAVAWAAASDSWLNVELKSAGVEEEVSRLITAAGLRDRTVISSFDPEPVRRMGEIDPGIRRFFLTERWNDSARRNLQRAEAGGVCLHVDDALADRLDDLRSRKLPVIVWTVNDPLVMRRLLEAGVAGIITDHPEVAVRVRREYEG